MTALMQKPFRTAFSHLANARGNLSCWVSPRSQLVIDGFPRSANTYLHRIIRAATPEGFRIAHHVHRPQQLAWAMDFGVPTFAVFRDPVEAICSLLVRRPTFGIDRATTLYGQIANLSAQHGGVNGMRIVRFEDITAHPIAVTNAILADLSLDTSVTAELIAAATLDKDPNSATSSLPRPERNALKDKVRGSVEVHPDIENLQAAFADVTENAWSKTVPAGQPQ